MGFKIHYLFHKSSPKTPILSKITLPVSILTEISYVIAVFEKGGRLARNLLAITPSFRGDSNYKKHKDMYFTQNVVPHRILKNRFRRILLWLSFKTCVKLTFHLDLIPSIYLHSQVLRYKGRITLTFMMSVLHCAYNELHLTALPTENQRLAAQPAVLSHTRAVWWSLKYTRNAIQ